MGDNAAGGGTSTVVVANADDDAREVVARVVEAAGFRAVRVGSAREVPVAVAVAVDSPAAAGAAAAGGAAGAVLDLGAANLEALEALRAGDAGEAPRVVVLGTGPANGRLALQASADGYLVRPFHARELQAALTDALARPDAERAPWRTEAAAAL